MHDKLFCTKVYEGGEEAVMSDVIRQKNKMCPYRHWTHFTNFIYVIVGTATAVV